MSRTISLDMNGMQRARISHTRNRSAAAYSRTRQLETAVVVVIFLLLIVGVTVTGLPRTAENSTMKSVSVQKGETLWSLAEKYPIPGLSTAQTAELLARINSIDGASISENTTLKVPANDGDVLTASR